MLECVTIENDGQVVAGNKNNAAWVRTSREGMDIGGFKQNYKKTGICISEKIVRRLMKEEAMEVKREKAGKYNSYKGEITPAVLNRV